MTMKTLAAVFAAAFLWAPFSQAEDVTKSMVDQYCVTWTIPTTAVDGTPLEGAQALNRIELYATVNADPASGDAPRTSLPPSETSYCGQVGDDFPQLAGGDRVVWGAKACNDKCSSYTNFGAFVLEVAEPNPPAPLGVN